MTNARLLFVHALSPLHAGTGQGVGVIDMPIAREKATGLPYLPGSSVKGTLRDSDKITDDDKQVIFGPVTEFAEDNAGAAQFSDQRLLLLPVRSLAGTFAWVTSPFVLHRFARYAMDAGAQKLPNVPGIDRGTGEDEYKQCLVAQSCQLKISGQTVVLEDLDLTATESGDENDDVTKWAKWIAGQLFPEPADKPWQGILVQRFCVVHDDLLSFLLTTATEVVARIKLKDDTKTVDTDIGGLWYEEALPTETVLAGLVVATPVQKSKVRSLNNGKRAAPRDEAMNAPTVLKMLEPATKQVLQFGGKATVGHGVCRVVLTDGAATPTQKTEEGQHANA